MKQQKTSNPVDLLVSLALLTLLGLCNRQLPAADASPHSCAPAQLNFQVFRSLAEEQLSQPTHNTPFSATQQTAMQALKAGRLPGQLSTDQQLALQQLPSFSSLPALLKLQGQCVSPRQQQSLQATEKLLAQLGSVQACSLSWQLRSHLQQELNQHLSLLVSQPQQAQPWQALERWLAQGNWPNSCSNSCLGRADRAYLSATTFAQLPAKGQIDPLTIRFAQDSIRESFKNPAEGTVWDLAAALQEGKVLASALPPIKLVLRHQKVFTLNHRRLFSFKAAQQAVPYQKEIYQPAQHARYFTTDSCGETLRIRPAGDHDD